jgi:hypothetical protein
MNQENTLVLLNKQPWEYEADYKHTKPEEEEYNSDYMIRYHKLVRGDDVYYFRFPKGDRRNKLNLVLNDIFLKLVDHFSILQLLLKL